ncbi:YeeE/YedE family protein [uncultured Planktomarina sp.]|jgi:uncharacterized membrane protein YedE/YeeE|uniref:YeeE/YedE family protein n=1 Tax=uncultured Planktomarina sp. TaxID=1538529 RepID=UPI00326036FD
MKNLLTLISGLLFGFGLLLSGMADPAKVQNFLDLFGTWDPSLAFVMGGAIAVTMPGFWLVIRRNKPFFNNVFHLPSRTDLDARLITGSAIFGVGWGLGGFCPGPAMTALPLAAEGTLIFVATMLTGMAASKYVLQRRDSRV